MCVDKTKHYYFKTAYIGQTHLFFFNIHSNACLQKRAHQRANICFTGGFSATIFLHLNEKVWFIR